MGPLDTPPDATPFRSLGKDCYLYLGALELRALQREWGLTRSASDDTAAWTAKQVQFMQRLNGGGFEDKLAMLKVALSRWAEGAEVDLTDRAAADILDRIERKDGKPAGPKGRMTRIVQLYEQFFEDCFGDEEEDGGPKATMTTDVPLSREPDSTSPNGS